VDELERIVRELAADSFPQDSEFGDCLLCGADRDLYHVDRAAPRPRPKVHHLDRHQPSCAWRMAREWVERNPAK
jgi:hypothetical protein